MGPLKHLAASSALAGVLYWKYCDRKLAISCVASGVLADTDHLLEYADYCRKFHKDWTWSEFSSGTYFNEKQTVKVVFHSWEAAIIIWLYCIVKGKECSKWVLGSASGYTLHLLLDQIGNNLGGKSYFWLYRRRCEWKQALLLERSAK